MSTYTFRPSSFVSKDMVLEVRFLASENREKWYKGTVISVYHYGYRDDGSDGSDGYVKCEMMYKDNDYVDTTFYDKDFDDTNNLDYTNKVNVWRFPVYPTLSNLTKLIKKEVKSIKETLDFDNVDKEVKSIKKRLDLLEDYDDEEVKFIKKRLDLLEDYIYIYDEECKEQHMKKQKSSRMNMKIIMFGVVCVFYQYLILKSFQYFGFKPALCAL
jgi:hypothetical protein